MNNARFKLALVVPVAICGGAIIGMAVMSAMSRNSTDSLLREVDADMARIDARQVVGDKTRADDILRIAILEQLARTPRLTGREIERAAELIEVLEGRLGELGLSIDRTSGRINGLGPLPRDRSGDALLTGGESGDEKLRIELDRATAAAVARGGKVGPITQETGVQR